MTCLKCGSELAENWLVCPFCGRAVNYTPARRKRGNGQGCVYKLKNGTYLATVTTGYHFDESGKMHRDTRSKVFKKKSDAIAALPELKTKKAEKKLTFAQLYDAWLPTHRAGKSTMDCYKAAYKHFRNIAFMPISEIDVDDLQECLDDCPHGKRTRENMRALAGLMYKYGIPRHAVPDNLNLSQFLTVDGDPAAHREAFNDVQIAQIKKACGKVPHAELIYIMIYLGFRPSEFLALRKSDFYQNYVVGGAKTEAGTGRIVTISPKIKPYIDELLNSTDDYLVQLNSKDRLKCFTNEIFYPALEAIGIDNPMVEIAGGKTRHKYTPHTCRHTFATLMKRVSGADKDKQELIGHASSEMLRYYQDVDVTDLQKITDVI